MQTTKVGQKIAFDEFRLNNELHYAAKKAKQGNELISQFNELGALGKFDAETWETLKTDGVEPLRKQFEKKLQKDLKTVSVTSIRDDYKRQAMAEFEPLIESIEDFLSEGWGESYQNGFEHINLQFEDLVFADGKFIVDEQKAESKATIRVADEDEARLFDLGNEIEPLLKEMLSIYKKRGLNMWSFDLNELFPKMKGNDEQREFDVKACKWQNEYRMEAEEI